MKRWRERERERERREEMERKTVSADAVRFGGASLRTGLPLVPHAQYL